MFLKVDTLPQDVIEAVISRENVSALADSSPAPGDVNRGELEQFTKLILENDKAQEALIAGAECALALSHKSTTVTASAGTLLAYGMATLYMGWCLARRQMESDLSHIS